MMNSMPAPGARFRLRSKRLTMFVGAIAIAFAGVAAGSRPAKADAQDILRFLAGAAIIAAIANAVDDRHTPRYIDRWVLPDSCLETARVNRRNIQVYNTRCLERGGYHNLPNHCERSFRVNGHRRGGYVAECMWDAGYSRESGWRSPRDVQPVPPTPHSPPSFGHNNRLPQHCEMTYRQNGQRRNGYWGNCLRDAGFRNLPRDCRMRTRSGDRLYNRQCLRNAGYRRAR